MDEVSAYYRNGCFVAEQPVDWPEGTPVTVLRARNDNEIGIDESQWPTTEEELRDWLAWFDSLPPLEMTEDEARRIDEARAASRKENKEAMLKNWSEVEKLF